MKFKSIFYFSLMSVFLISATGYSAPKYSTDGKRIIRVATSNVEHEKTLLAAKEEFEKSGYKLEIKVFNDYTAPNMAVVEGSMDANYFQHEPFLKLFNHSKGTNLECGRPLYLITTGIFSNKIKSMKELKDGAKVAIFNDNSNRDFALRFLQHLGLIKLKKGLKIATKLDIVENKRNLKFIEMDGFNIVNMMDEVDIAVMAASHMAQAGKNPKSGIAYYNDAKGDDVRALVLTVRNGDMKTDWAKALEKALMSIKAQKVVEETSKGARIPAFK
ncbi:MAG: MetQ/NlpA family ABC transporter substrate-binding protein [Spirochaetota bacterium]